MPSNLLQAEQINSGFPATALTLMGNTSATGGPGIIFDNANKATSGKIVSFRSGGVELASIDFAGNLYLAGEVSPGVMGTLVLAGNSTSAGPAIQMENMTTLVSGDIVQFRNGATTEAHLDYAGNLFLNGTLNASSINVDTINTDTSGGLLTLAPNVTTTGSAIALKINNTSTLASGDKILSIQNNGTEKASIDYGGNLILGGALGSIEVGGASLSYSAGTSIINAAGFGANLRLIGSSTVTIDSSILGVSGGAVQIGNGLSIAGSISESTASTALTLTGNGAASAPGVILDNVTAATSGNSTISFRSGGAELASISFAGNLNIGPAFGTAALSPILVLNSADGTSAHASYLESYQNGTLRIFAPTWIGLQNPSGVNSLLIDNSVVCYTHLLANTQTSVPTVASFAANFGTVTGAAITGGDLAGIITFTTGTTGAIAANTALFVVTFSTAYSSTQFVAFASLAQAAGTLDVSSYYCVPGGSGASFTVYNTVGFTPGSSTTYVMQFMTMGAGATS
jgi:hypothetical protein